MDIFSNKVDNIFIPEVLSPAGSMESLVAAVRCGADAVYLGSGDFNARRSAANFSLNQNEENSLAVAIKYCHVRGCKVYLTLNTMVRSDELEGAFHLAKSAYQLGADAIIVQDIGLASIIKTHLPNFPLHASTQLSCHSANGVKSLIDLGFKRVVLAREMAGSEIETCVGLGAEIEVFVHGALCMSVSGQCLMSSTLGQRSGNRGLCAQPCRLPFSANCYNVADYHLSLKDLTLIDYVPALCEMGVTSFKIEGRMKRPQYVAAATAAFVHARNIFYGISTNETSFIPTKTDLEDVFSRSGFTAGYFENNIDKTMFGHRRYDDVISSKPSLAKLSPLFKSELKRIAVEFFLTLKQNEPSKLTAVDCDKNAVEVYGSFPEKAHNRPLDAQRAIEQLSKSGNTPFRITSHCDIGDGLTVPISALNALRRDALKQIELARAEVKNDDRTVHLSEPDFNIDKTKLNGAKMQIIAQLSPIFMKLSGSDGAKLAHQLNNSSADIFILPLDTQHEIFIKLSKLLHRDKKIGVEIPRGEFNVNDGYIEKLSELKTLGVTFLLVGNVAGFNIVYHARALGFEVVANVSLNIANQFSAQTLSNLGAGYVTLSSELSFAQIGNIALHNGYKLGIFAYGKQPIMMLRNCPVKAHKNGGCKACFYQNVDKRDGPPHLTDRKKIDFQINCYKNHGFVELVNSRGLYLADEPALKKSSNLSFLLLYFTDETLGEMAEIIDNYAYNSISKKTFPLADKLFTRGCYRKGVV